VIDTIPNAVLGNFVCWLRRLHKLCNTHGLDLPVRLIAIPEGARQGFNDEVLDLDHAQFAREGAIDIPGEETEILGQLAREYDTFIIAQAKGPASRLEGSILQCGLHPRPSGRGHPAALQGVTAISGRALDVSA